MIFKKSYLGIDLTPESIKAAYLIKNGNKKKIVNLYCMDNPLGKTLFKKSKEKKVLKECLQKINKKFPSSNVIIGISSQYTTFRQVHLPKLNKRELREAVFWELQEFTSVLNGKFKTDYEVVEQQEQSFQVLLAAVPEHIIIDYTEIAIDAGMNVKSLDVYPLANTQVIKVLQKYSISAVIDLNSTYSEITIVDKGKMKFTRKLDINYDNILNHGSTDFKESNNLDKYKIKMPSYCQQLLYEISRMFDFFSLQNQGNQVGEIILIGKDSKQLKEIFKNTFNVKVFTGTDLNQNFLLKNNHRIDYDKNTDFFSAIGFALRG